MSTKLRFDSQLGFAFAAVLLRLGFRLTEPDRSTFQAEPPDGWEVKYAKVCGSGQVVVRDPEGKVRLHAPVRREGDTYHVTYHGDVRLVCRYECRYVSLDGGASYMWQVVDNRDNAVLFRTPASPSRYVDDWGLSRTLLSQAGEEAAKQFLATIPNADDPVAHWED